VYNVQMRLSIYTKNFFNIITMDFLSSLKSRKLVMTIAGFIASYFFPEMMPAIVSLVGIYCGTNVAQKFSSAHTELIEATTAAKLLGEEAVK